MALNIQTSTLGVKLLEKNETYFGQLIHRNEIKPQKQIYTSSNYDEHSRMITPL